ncbi:hypothetical protein L873DRAFT_1809842 [Choiromyces venosus 120613-1]|uniref:ABM domain-containing protein n=1 Tax=Choiromyces venosus 120613-1 TaxID=1336337 RepID=A0A3N4JUE9_9PEZI|nr:hypothetical protein L873DRAFT_1809842 [Choiromyces venosus 120613-1]
MAAAASTSTGPVTEFVTFALNGSSYEGQDTLLSQNPPKNPPLAGFWGLQHEDEAKLHWLISWNSLAEHAEFRQSENYKPFVATILPWTNPEGLKLVHAELNPSNPQVDEAPVSEWCTITLSEGTTRQEFLANFKEFEKGLKGEGYRWHTSGWVTENPRDYMLLIGWDSVKAHTDWRASELGQTAVGHLRKGVDDIHMIHVKFGGKFR